MKDTKISILIPVYNVENYLRECLDSIIAQTFQDFKVICVDDGSDDKSFEILQEYQKKDKRFSVIRQEHKGVGAARNLALSLAKSKYIQFLDSDDFIEPEMLKEMYDTAVKYDTDMVVCTAVRRAPDGTFIEENDIVPVNKNLAIFNTPFNWKDCPDKIFNMFSPESWQVLYKKELLDKNGLRFPDLTSSNGAALGYIARLDLPPTYMGQGHDSRLVFDAEYALRMGADAVMVNVGQGVDVEEPTYPHLAETIAYCDSVGLPVCSEPVPGGFDAGPEFKTLDNNRAKCIWFSIYFMSNI